MEKARIGGAEFGLRRVESRPPLLEIAFVETINLAGANLDTIDILTSGGKACATFIGYDTIYRAMGNTVTLSSDGSIYKEPLAPEAEDVEDKHEPSLQTMNRADIDYLAIMTGVDLDV